MFSYYQNQTVFQKDQSTADVKVRHGKKAFALEN